MSLMKERHCSLAKQTRTAQPERWPIASLANKQLLYSWTALGPFGPVRRIRSEPFFFFSPFCVYTLAVYHRHHFFEAKGGPVPCRPESLSVFRFSLSSSWNGPGRDERRKEIVTRRLKYERDKCRESFVLSKKNRLLRMLVNGRFRLGSR